MLLNYMNHNTVTGNRLAVKLQIICMDEKTWLTLLSKHQSYKRKNKFRVLFSVPIVAHFPEEKNGR